MSNDLERYSDEAINAEYVRRKTSRSWIRSYVDDFSSIIRSSTFTVAQAAELNTLIGIEIDKVTVKPIQTCTRADIERSLNE